nr:T cell receptor beta [Andrias davidianus]
MQGTCSLFALTLLFHYGRALSIDQRPRFLSLSPGKAVRIECSVQGYASPYMYWYRTFPKKPFEMMFLSRVKDQVDDSPEKHFSATRTTSQDFILETESVSLNDTAEYYCAWSMSSGTNQQYFGSGTKLTVLEDGITETTPNVVLFDPSPQEINEKGKATLVCLANRFYPDHVTLSWSVNGVERTAGVKTDDSPTSGDASLYFLSSRLRLSKKEWFRPQNTFRCTVHFHPKNVDISKETKGREDCGVTPDSYRKSANTAKFTYLLLIAKSAFYGLFVTLLVWKMKPGGEKNFT